VGDSPGFHGRRTLIEHWNGKAWKVQVSPNRRGFDSQLSGVAATSSTNAWAVGFHWNVGRTLIEHWNGKAWKVQASPNRGDNGLSGVAATSPRNAWAVGDSPGFHGRRTLIEHWNGKAWKVQASPNRGVSGLSGVAATSPRNAWAVGSSFPSRRSTRTETLIEHWNGKAWKVQVSPNRRGFYLNQLSGVAASSATNAWAVGYSFGSSPTRKPPVTETLIEHWNGKTWRIQVSPNRRGFPFSQLSGVAATSSTHAWAVGFSFGGFGRAGPIPAATLALRCG
jgi:hypothetical protein